MAVLKNELVWSHSRAKTFQWCRRAYWYTYYGSWGGWEADAPEATRNAWLQKKLTAVPAWVGTLVHGIAENLLKEAMQGEKPIEEEAADRAVRTANRQIRESERQLGRPGKATRFAEHYYDEKVEWDPLVDEIERQVRGLFSNRIFRRLLEVPDRILEVEELRRFPVGDAEVYVSLDVLVSDGQGGAVILDWKTGESHKDEDIAAQLGVYGLYCAGPLGLDPSRLVAMHVNLRHATETRHPVGPAEVALAEQEIARSVAELRSVLTDVEKNVAGEDFFPLLPEGDPRCGSCRFRRSCLRG